MRIFLVIYNNERNEEVVQMLEPIQLESFLFSERGAGRAKAAKSKQEKQIWTGTKAIMAVAVSGEKESAFFKAIQEINDTYRDANARAFSFQIEEVA